MKKLIAVALITLCTSTMAQHSQHNRHGHGYWQRGNSNWVWVAPTIIGGVIGYEIARQQPIVIQPPLVINQQNCSVWTEIMNADGTITRTRTCIQ